MAWGKSATQAVTVKNTGTAPATVTLGETPGGAVIAKPAGAPLNLVKGSYSPHSLAAHGAKAGAKSTAGKATRTRRRAHRAPPGTAWQTVPDLPVDHRRQRGRSSYNGTVYSAFGYTGAADTSDLYAYSADSGAWTKLASAADTREAPAHGVIGGKFYAAGGWGASRRPGRQAGDLRLRRQHLEHRGQFAQAVRRCGQRGTRRQAVRGRRLHRLRLRHHRRHRLRPGQRQLGRRRRLSRAGGLGVLRRRSRASCTAPAAPPTRAASSTPTSYDPAADSWSPIADQPTDAWGASYTSANGLLLVKGGAINAGAALTNQTWAYNPADNSWTALPNANNSLYRGGGAAGFYSVGGLAGTSPAKSAELLPGYDQPDVTDVTWLTESATSVTLAPGASTTLTVTLDASVPEITQPGTFTAAISLATDTPYASAPVERLADRQAPGHLGQDHRQGDRLRRRPAGRERPSRSTPGRRTTPSRRARTAATRCGSTSATTRCRSSSPRTATSRPWPP